MSIFSRLFGRKLQRSTPAASPPSAPIVEPSPTRTDVHRGLGLSGNSDVISGWRFCATMQLRTPLRVLSRHGEVHEETANDPPVIAREQWEGIWLHKLLSFHELGLDMDETAFPMASDIGQVPSDGGDYLPFLVAVRTAAEGEGSIADRREAVANVLRDTAQRKFVRAHGGQGAILDQLFPPFVAAIPRISANVAQALASAGYRTPAKIGATSDKELRAVDGVGPATVKALREAAAAAADQSARYVDRVIR